MDEFIRNASIEDYKRSYMWDDKEAEFVCLICGARIKENNHMNAHVNEHGTSIERLLSLSKKYTGLTEIQKELLEMVSSQFSNSEIAVKLGWTESTVRNMRFALRERARQARAFLAIMDLVEEAGVKKSNLKLRTFPENEEKRKALLPRFADLFEQDRNYTEAEVKKVIKTVYGDDATIRRYLVDYGYLCRTNDGRKYYKKCEANNMISINKKELISEYKQQEIEMGIIQVYNRVNGYSMVDICTNLYKPFESIKFQLNLGKTRFKKLKDDWAEYGEKGFEFRVVEKLKPKESATEKEKIDDLKELLSLWIESQGDSLKLYK